MKTRSSALVQLAVISFALGCGPAAGSEGDASTTTTESGGEPGGQTCEAGCTGIRAYPIDVAMSCVDTSSHLVVGCNCGTNGGPGCVRWTEDGRLFMADNADGLLWTDEEPAMPLDLGFEACTQAESASAVTSCDLAQCPNGSYSTCSMTDTCETLSNAFGVSCSDSGMIAADGCARPRCQDDTECDAGLVCRDFFYMPSCEYGGDGTCTCSMRSGGPPDQFCAPPG